MANLWLWLKTRGVRAAKSQFDPIFALKKALI